MGAATKAVVGSILLGTEQGRSREERCWNNAACMHAKPCCAGISAHPRPAAAVLIILGAQPPQPKPQSRTRQAAQQAISMHCGLRPNHTTHLASVTMQHSASGGDGCVACCRRGGGGAGEAAARVSWERWDAYAGPNDSSCHRIAHLMPGIACRTARCVPASVWEG